MVPSNVKKIHSLFGKIDSKSICQEISYQFLYLLLIKKILNQKNVRCQRNASKNKRVVFYCLYCSKKYIKYKLFIFNVFFTSTS